MKQYLKQSQIKKFIFDVFLAVLIFAMCSGCATNQQPDEYSNNESEQQSTEETESDFELPEDYEETAKQLASNFTIQWALAYRSNEGNVILETLLDDYSDMIGSLRNDIVTDWNSSHKNGANAWYIYVSGPTVSSVIVKDNQIENDAVHLTVNVSLMGTAQLYTTVYWGTTGDPKSVSDHGTYEMSYDSNGWHFETVHLKLSQQGNKSNISESHIAAKSSLQKESDLTYAYYFRMAWDNMYGFDGVPVDYAVYYRFDLTTVWNTEVTTECTYYLELIYERDGAIP